MHVADEETLTEACQKVYEEVVTNKQSPPKKLLSLLPVFKVLSKDNPTPPQVDLPEEHLAVLHICLSCIRTTYQKENQKSSFLLNVAQLISEVIPKIDESSLKSSLTTSKLWSSFVKQVCWNMLFSVDLLTIVKTHFSWFSYPPKF